MPLTKSKSKKAFSHNVEAEMHAGKPQRQAVAIAYAVQRKAKKASGGSMSPHSYDSDWDYRRAMGEDMDSDNPETEEKESYKIPRKEEKKINKLEGRIGLEKKALASGRKEEASKQSARIGRNLESERARAGAKYEESVGNKQKAQSHRKEWETTFKKPAPFKKGGKVTHPCW